MTKALSTKARGGGCFIFLFGMVFVCVGLGIFCAFTVWPMAKSVQARSWEPTPCYITSSRVDEVSGEDSMTYAVDIHYSYEYNGIEYRSDNYDFIKVHSSGRSRKQKIVNQYPVNADATCYVNPKQPDESVLSRSFSMGYFIGCFGLLFFAAGAGVIYATFRGSQSKGALSVRGRRRQRKTVDMTPSRYPVELKAKSGPIAKFVGMLIFSAIWNVIVFGILIAQWSERSSGISWFVILFLIPFVLVGVGTFAGVVYFGLAMFNPRPKLQVSKSAARLGESVEIDWAIVGSPYRIESFRITLEGREEATYRRGTDTHTDRETFLTIDVLEVTDVSSMSEGHAVFTVPEYTMHSFDASNNKVVWSLKVHGAIPKWPDIDDEFPFTVLPLSIEGV